MQPKAEETTKTWIGANKPEKEVEQQEGHLRGGSGDNGGNLQGASHARAVPDPRDVWDRQKLEDRQGCGADIARRRFAVLVAGTTEERGGKSPTNSDISAGSSKGRTRKSKDGEPGQTTRGRPLGKGQR